MAQSNDDNDAGAIAGDASADGAFQRDELQAISDSVNAEFDAKFGAPDDAPELVVMDVDPQQAHAYWSVPDEVVDNDTFPLVLRVEGDDGVPVDVELEGPQGREYLDTAGDVSVTLQQGNQPLQQTTASLPSGSPAPTSPDLGDLLPPPTARHPLPPPPPPPTRDPDLDGGFIGGTFLPPALQSALAERSSHGRDPASVAADVIDLVAFGLEGPAAVGAAPDGMTEPAQAASAWLERLPALPDLPRRAQASVVSGSAAEDSSVRDVVWWSSGGSGELVPHRHGEEAFGGGFSGDLTGIAQADLWGAPFSGGDAPPLEEGLEVHVELIVWGRARPHRQLALWGQPIRQRPDGSFSFRRRLPTSGATVPPLAIEAKDGRAALPAPPDPAWAPSGSDDDPLGD